ncbi:MAG: hypothetical protein R2752_06830 [Vicinamibacterales bacterium]
MSHLTPQQFVDALEGRPAGVAQAHLDHCGPCRAQVAELRALVQDARRDETPEPSPLFWDHFGDRVRDAVDDVRVPGRTTWWPGGWRLALVGSAMMAVAVFAVVATVRVAPDLPAPVDRVARDVEVAGPMPLPADDDVLVAAPGEAAVGAAAPAAAPEAWQKVMALGDELPSEDLVGVAPASPGTGPLIEDLSQAQLREFLRLLRAERGGM